MPYPKSPFCDNFNDEILRELRGGDDVSTVNEIDNSYWLEILEWLCKTPEITTFRVNTLKGNVGDVYKHIRTHMENVLGPENSLYIEVHLLCKECIIIHHAVKKHSQLKLHDKEIIIDPICAAAVLRGAHIYAPGVMGMHVGTQIGDEVSVFADIAKKCKKGLQKTYNDRKIFIGNGIVKMGRKLLFCENSPTGIAIVMKETISNCPPLLGDPFLPTGLALLQNLPSIVCVHVLDPQPNEYILDMCASPGNKTTHIAALMQNRGKLVAIDKTPAKIQQLKQRCDEFGAKVDIIHADSTKLMENTKFTEEKFDRILLDAPCSALGKRPQLLNSTSLKILKSYIPLQRKLLANAVKLLKPDGILVYSTCTITLAENERIVSWALKNFPLELMEASPILGGPALAIPELSSNDLQKIQRFGPKQSIDSVGFFIAKFIKTHK